MQNGTMAGVVAAVALLASTAGAAGDPVRGRELAENLCGRCHAWDPKAPWNSIGSTPSFMWMAKKLDFYRERILSVTNRLPHIAQRFDVTIQDLENILAYIETLAPQRTATRTVEEKAEEDATAAALRRYLQKLRRGDD